MIKDWILFNVSYPVIERSHMTMIHCTRYIVVICALHHVKKLSIVVVLILFVAMSRILININVVPACSRVPPGPDLKKVSWYSGGS